jgi:hypothetical protein
MFLPAFDFQLFRVERIDLDLVVFQMDPDPVIALPAELDRWIILHQPIKNVLEFVTVQLGKNDKGVFVHGGYSSGIIRPALGGFSPFE